MGLKQATADQIEAYLRLGGRLKAYDRWKTARTFPYPRAAAVVLPDLPGGKVTFNVPTPDGAGSCSVGAILGAFTYMIWGPGSGRELLRLVCAAYERTMQEEPF